MIDLQRNKLLHLSYSSLSLYMDCARKWKYKYVDLLPEPSSSALAFGSALHLTLAEIARLQTSGRPAFAVENIIDEVWQASFKKVFDNLEELEEGETRQGLAELGMETFEDPDVLEFLNSMNTMVIGNEPQIEKRVTFYVPGVPLPILGYIDRIGADAVPYDYKTAGRSWNLQQAEEELQTLFYLAALRSLEYPHNMTFRHVIFPKKGPNKIQVLEHRHTEAELDWLYDAIRDAWKGIKAEVYSPNPSGNYCSPKCGYWNICRGKR